jgi:TonB dependent receptor-like, beta-barrel/CarboxypepD_reg-like domain/TonB-dependent Receptor Plug Domain
MKYCFLLLLFFSTVINLHAQQKFTLSGYVKDSTSGESLIGASIAVKNGTQGVNTNDYGFYSITLPAGNYTFIYSFLGYNAEGKIVKLDHNQELDIMLSPRSILSKEVVITDERKNENVTNTEMSKIALSMRQVKALPAIGGEVDILKALQLLPGVQSAGEGNTGFYVRGGGPDENLILLDEAPVYNTGHLFGFFSVFNADAIQNVTLIKGGMPANYGGRLSSVVDISMKEGNNKELHGEGGVGIIASRLSLEGPLEKNKSSFMISGRRTYIDYLIKPFISKSSSFAGSGYYFYDLNAKVNYIFSDKNRLYLSGYFGKDVFDFKSSEQTFDAHIPWGNSTATLRWNHVFNDKLFANTSLIYNNYQFLFGATQNDFNFQLSSGIKDANAKMDFDYFMNPKHHIQFGFDYIYHTFKPSTASGSSDTTGFHPNNPLVKYAHEAAVYLLDDYSVSKKWKVNFGLRYSFFQQVGPYVQYTEDAAGNITDSTVYKSLQPVKTYGGLEPRIILRYELNETSSLKASVTRNLQYIHLVSNSATTLPTDLWVPSTSVVKPEIGWEYSSGYFRNFNDNVYETSLEVYYRTMQNQIEFEEGYTPSLADPQNSFVFGKGWSYGAELFIHKQKGKLTGWVGYTLAWTWRQFPALNNGNKYPAKYDRRNDLSIVATYELNKHWTLSGDFVFATGNAVTIPDQFYFIEGSLTQQYSSINSYRMPPYDRLDLSAVYTPTPKPDRKFSHYWIFSVYNVYSRLNPYFIYFDQTGSLLDGDLKVQAKKVSIFPVLPSVTWDFTF